MQVVTRRGLPMVAAVVTLPPWKVCAEDDLSSDLGKLKAGLIALEDLVTNWDERTLNCKYAEVNRELLSKKKELLEEASKNALMSKSDTVTTTLCKRDPEAVRLLLGLDTNIKKKGGVPSAFADKGIYDAPKASTLVGADRIIKRRLKDANDFDAYVEAQEDWLRALSALDSSTYASGAADFSALIVASDGEDRSGSQLLNDAKRNAVQARDAIRIIVKELLPTP